MLSCFPGISTPSVHEKHGKYAFRSLLVKDNCRKKSGHALKEITLEEFAQRNKCVTFHTLLKQRSRLRSKPKRHLPCLSCPCRKKVHGSRHFSRVSFAEATSICSLDMLKGSGVIDHDHPTAAGPLRSAVFSDSSSRRLCASTPTHTATPLTGVAGVGLSEFSGVRGSRTTTIEDCMRRAAASRYPTI
jgi:hypothetical protein